MSEAMEQIQKSVDQNAARKEAERTSLKAAVPIHPAMADQSKAEAAKRDEKGKFAAKEPAKTEPAKPATEPAKAPDQGENWRALSAKVEEAKARAAAAEAKAAALEAQIGKVPPKNPMDDVRAKVMARVPAESKDFWEKVVLPSMQDIVAPIQQEAATLKEELRLRDEAVAMQNRIFNTYSDFTRKNNLSDAQRTQLIEAVNENGLSDFIKVNPDAALTAAYGILLAQGKFASPTPEQVEAAKKAADEAKEREAAEDRARAKAGGLDSSASAASPGTGDGKPDWHKLIADAQARGNWSEVRNLRNKATLAAAGVDRDWLAGKKNILRAGQEG